LAKDTANNGNEHGGVNPKYRPRGYNEGPKE
jgi:protein O-mannosyl-transferase